MLPVLLVRAVQLVQASAMSFIREGRAVPVETARRGVVEAEEVVPASRAMEMPVHPAVRLRLARQPLSAAGRAATVSRLRATALLRISDPAEAVAEAEKVLRQKAATALLAEYESLTTTHGPLRQASRLSMLKFGELAAAEEDSSALFPTAAVVEVEVPIQKNSVSP